MTDSDFTLAALLMRLPGVINVETIGETPYMLRVETVAADELEMVLAYLALCPTQPQYRRESLTSALVEPD